MEFFPDNQHNFKKICFFSVVTCPIFIYLFIQRRLSTQDKITKQQQNDNVTAHSTLVQSRYKIYKTSNHSIESSCLRPEAQQGLPHLNESFASRLKIHEDD